MCIFFSITFILVEWTYSSNLDLKSEAEPNLPVKPNLVRALWASDIYVIRDEKKAAAHLCDKHAHVNAMLVFYFGCA